MFSNWNFCSETTLLKKRGEQQKQLPGVNCNRSDAFYLSGAPALMQDTLKKRPGNGPWKWMWPLFSTLTGSVATLQLPQHGSIPMKFIWIQLMQQIPEFPVCWVRVDGFCSGRAGQCSWAVTRVAGTFPGGCRLESVWVKGSTRPRFTLSRLRSGAALPWARFCGRGSGILQAQYQAVSLAHRGKEGQIAVLGLDRPESPKSCSKHWVSVRGSPDNANSVMMEDKGLGHLEPQEPGKNISDRSCSCVSSPCVGAQWWGGGCFRRKLLWLLDWSCWADGLCSRWGITAPLWLDVSHLRCSCWKSAPAVCAASVSQYDVGDVLLTAGGAAAERDVRSQHRRLAAGGQRWVCSLKGCTMRNVAFLSIFYRRFQCAYPRDRNENVEGRGKVK